jgi:endonuclease YncB( thermonuclease family)
MTVFVCLFALAAPWRAVQAEDLPADPEQVLRAAGLVLSGNSYIPETEAEAESIPPHVGEIKVRLSKSQSRYQTLLTSYLEVKAGAARLEFEEFERHHSSEEDRKISAQANSLWNEALALEPGIITDQKEIRREEFRYSDLVARTPREYTALAADPRIKDALRALNKGRHPKLALGPVAAYEKNLLKQSIELLAVLGYRREGDVFWLAGEADLIGEASHVERLWAVVTGSEPRPAPPGQAVAAPATMKPLDAGQVAAKRAELVRRVRQLRRQVDALQEHRDVLLAEGEDRDALDEINRAKGRMHLARLGSKPGFEQLLQNLERWERGLPVKEVPLNQGEGPGAPVPEPAAEAARVLQDLSKLPARNVVLVPDGDTIIVSNPDGGTIRLRLLGVTAPSSDGASLRRASLARLVKDQDVRYDAHEPPRNGRTVALVYRVSDGLLVNLEMVKEGYSVTASDAPATLRGALEAAEQTARAKRLGLWSPEASEAAAPPRQEAHPSTKKKPAKKGNAPFPAGQRPVNIEQAAMQEAYEWLDQQKLAVLQRKAQIDAYWAARRAAVAPEIDPGRAAGALALLVAGVLMLVERRRASSA